MHFYDINESANRYSVEVNYRTTMNEVFENWAKLVLGYVSAAMKNDDFIVKRVFTEHPYRIICSKQNFIDGEWVGVVSYNPKGSKFQVSKGFYQKDTGNVVVTATNDVKGTSAAEIAKEFKNFMHGLKDEVPRHPKLNPVKSKTGPTQGSMRPGQGLMNKGRPDAPEAKMGV